MKCKCIELSDISEYEDNDSCKAKYTIMQLQQENKQLKECYCNRTDCSGRIKNSRKYDSLYQKYNKQLDNWNKLKEYLNYKSERAVGEDEYVYDEIYNEMQEMEKNYGNN